MKVNVSSVRFPGTISILWLLQVAFVGLAAGNGSGSSVARRTASSSSSSGSSWWQEESEVQHLRECIGIALLLLTLMFEIIHHKLMHIADSIEDYRVAKSAGDKSHTHYEVATHQVDHRTLWGLLLRRATAEFTVLGFAAFIVWCFNEGEVFHAMQEQFGGTSDIALPLDGATYFHMVEGVHMQLFVGMLFYFLLMAISLVAASRYMYPWFEVEQKIRDGFKNGEIQQNKTVEWSQNLDAKDQRFVRLRVSFFLGLQDWRGKWPFFDSTVGKILDFYAPGKHDELREVLEPCFPFTQYVSINYRMIFDDMVEMQPSTWASIIALLGFQAIMHRTVGDFEFSYLWVGVTCLIMASIAVYTQVRMRFLQTGNFRHNAALAHPWFHKRSPAMMVCRALQMLLFLICFQLASVIANKHSFQNRKKGYMVHLGFFLVSVLPMGIALGIAFARIAVTSACGAFITERNALRIAVIAERHFMGKDSDRKRMGDDVEIFDHAAEELNEKIAHGDFIS
eukprot:TRINITY_DN39139_c0_g1_i1.p1 TRINITY_DN39139_c0_g1~~TRINITY_DN39139_c0_g1_i1.p1  ORF type:complete len:509 (-),score=49.09 TRINITY_DN39139_c0_g1_i1:213-1739(-)